MIELGTFLAFVVFFWFLALSLGLNKGLVGWAALLVLTVAAACLFPQSRYAWTAFGVASTLFFERVIKREWAVWRESFARAWKAKSHR